MNLSSRIFLAMTMMASAILAANEPQDNEPQDSSPMTLNLSHRQLSSVPEEVLFQSGLEQFVGQALMTIDNPREQSRLMTWNREKAGSSAEVNYLRQKGTTILLIEVKAGHTGRLKSLHLFMEEKNAPLASGSLLIL